MNNGMMDRRGFLKAAGAAAVSARSEGERVSAPQKAGEHVCSTALMQFIASAFPAGR